MIGAGAIGAGQIGGGAGPRALHVSAFAGMDALGKATLGCRKSAAVKAAARAHAQRRAGLARATEIRAGGGFERRFAVFPAARLGADAAGSKGVSKPLAAAIALCAVAARALAMAKAVRLSALAGGTRLLALAAASAFGLAAHGSRAPRKSARARLTIKGSANRHWPLWASASFALRPASKASHIKRALTALARRAIAPWRGTFGGGKQ
jgi:hypothetical protein